VVIGGGTGTFAVLSGLKKYPLNLTAIVSMTDSGGSTGRLRDQLGVLPPGDVRQCLVALSEESLIWRKLFTYRFEEGDLAGHSFGNIFLSTVEKLEKSLPQAIKISQKLLQTGGNIVPVTLDKSTLHVKLSDGTIITGENNIEDLGNDWNSPIRKITRCWISPDAAPNKEALLAITQADFIIIGPGDLYTSILPNFLVNKVARRVVKSKAKKIYVTNLMNKRGQTDNFTTGDFVAELKKYIKNLTLNYVIMNTGKIQTKAVGWYQKTCEVDPVINDLRDTPGTKVIKADIVSSTIYGKTVSDRIMRTLIRHHPDKLGKILTGLIL